MPIEVKTVKESLLEITDFIQSYPSWQVWPQDLVSKFINDFISSPEMIIGCYENSKLIMISVLLDKINNPSNDACLEILGIDPKINFSSLLKLLLDHSSKICPKYRSGIQISLTKELGIHDNLLNELKLKHHYDTFEMLNTSFIANPLSDPSIFKADKTNAKEIYEALVSSFSDNIDTSIPQFEDWNSNFLKNDNSSYYLYISDQKIVGFINLILHKTKSEIRTVGVLKKYRSKGIATKLIVYALNEILKFNIRECNLSVSTQNKSALKLYHNLGFQVVKVNSCYRKGL